MTTNYNIEVFNDLYFLIMSGVQYIFENFFGLMLLIFSFFIIYFVEYISRINSMGFALPLNISNIKMKSSKMKSSKNKKQ